MRRVLRLKAIVPLGLLLALSTAASAMFMDKIVEQAIEAVGTDIVGAKVELDGVEIDLAGGSVRLMGLQVTNPDSPMANLFQAEEIVADIDPVPLLEKKILVDTLAVRGLRFDTPRETSGAVERPAEQTGLIRRRIDQWAQRVQVPAFSLDGLTGTVDVAALNPDNLATPRAAAALSGAIDSSRTVWTEELASLDPQPAIDSGRALVERLSGASLISLGVRGAAQSLDQARRTLSEIDRVRGGVQELEADVTNGVDSFGRQVRGLADARNQDIAAALSALSIPSLDAPDISPALFGEVALARLKPVLYWLQVAEEYLPPGLDPRRRPGPNRARAPGSTVEFPKESEYAGFAVRVAEIDFALEEGPAEGNYTMLLNDLSSAPAVHGRPLQVAVGRQGGTTGPSSIRAHAVFDHISEISRDSIGVGLAGVGLPSFVLPGLGTEIDLGSGLNEISLVRRGDSLSGRIRIQSDNVSWSRGSLGTGRVNDIVWRALATLNDVDVAIDVGGSIFSPRVRVSSNVADAIARNLRQELEGEIRAAEQRVRAEVDRLVAEPMAQARASVAEVESTVSRVVQGHLQQLDAVKQELEAKIRDLRRMVPGN
ncbi:MAG: TIGR03545 family protein [Gemmatimonadota bacterium]|nr:TIGR03545 family protein [Gemmatimonadota bacterium]